MPCNGGKGPRVVWSVAGEGRRGHPPTHTPQAIARRTRVMARGPEGHGTAPPAPVPHHTDDAGTALRAPESVRRAVRGLGGGVRPPPPFAGDAELLSRDSTCGQGDSGPPGTPPLPQGLGTGTAHNACGGGQGLQVIGHNQRCAASRAASENGPNGPSCAGVRTARLADVSRERNPPNSLSTAPGGGGGVATPAAYVCRWVRAGVGDGLRRCTPPDPSAPGPKGRVWGVGSVVRGHSGSWAARAGHVAVLLQGHDAPALRRSSDGDRAGDGGV